MDAPDPLDDLRDMLPPDEMEELSAVVAEVTEAVSSPQGTRRWARKAAREQAQEQAPLLAYRRLRGGS